MQRIFQKKIDYIHSHRDYDSEFASKADVLPSLRNKSVRHKKLHRTQSNYIFVFKKFLSKKTIANERSINSMNDSNNTDEEELEIYKAHYAFFEFHKRKFFFAKKSLYFLDETSNIRRFAVWLTESKWFEIVTIALIILNAILLGIVDYNGESKNSANKVYDAIEPIVIIYNVIEALLKIIARGFTKDSKSYIKDGINAIDFFVAVTGILYFLDTFRYFSILRLPRVLLFFQNFKIFKSVKQMMKVLIYSAWPLVSIISLLLFFMFIFAILGLHLFVGKLSYRCRVTPFPINGQWETTNELNICGSGYTCSNNATCGSNFEYQEDIVGNLKQDIYFPAFNYGLTTFDNVFQSLFTVFIINIGNWNHLTMMLSDASDNWIALVYCSITYIVCNFFILQIAVAVMLDDFSKNKETFRRKTNMTTLMLRGDKMDEKTVNAVPEQKVNTNFLQRLKSFTNKHFPKVKVPRDEYYQNPFTIIAYKIACNSVFRVFTIVLIIINMVILAIDRYPIPQGQENFISNVTTNNVLVYLFLAEVIIKLIAYGSEKYLQDNFNLFEFVVAIVSIVEISGRHRMSIASVLRSLRLLKYLKNEYSWDNFRVLVIVVFEGFTYVAGFMSILGIYMYVFAVLGMKYFSERLKFDENGFLNLETGVSPQSNFDTLIQSYTVVFQVLVGENFLEVILDAIRAVGWNAIIYFIALVVTGKYLLLQMFLAVMLGAFEEARNKVTFGQVTSKAFVSKILKRKLSRKFDKLALQTNKHSSAFPYSGNILFIPKNQCCSEHKLPVIFQKHQDKNNHDEESILQQNLNKETERPLESIVFSEMANNPEVEQSKQETQRRFEFDEESTSRPLNPRIGTMKNLDVNHFKARSVTNIDRLRRLPSRIPSRSTRVFPDDYRLERDTKKTQGLKEWINSFVFSINNRKDSSLLIFHKSSVIRIWVTSIINHKYWESLIIGSILLSSLLLILDSPLDDPNSAKSKAYSVIDKTFTIFFAVEMLLKIISMGFLFNYEDDKNAYIRSYWNMLDCLVVFTSGIDLITGGESGLKSLKSLRALRALRPLRVISRNENLRLIVNALFRTIPSLKNLMIVVGLIIIISATMGVELFKGTFYYCEIEPNLEKQIITRNDCLDNGGVWLNNQPNFDNFFQGALSFLKIITGEGWISGLHSAINAVGIDMQPKNWNHPAMVIYFYCFLLIGNIFIKNLFVGVVIDNFRQMKEELGGFLLLNEMQRDWVEMQIFMQRKKLKRVIPEPENSIRQTCFKIATDHRFENFVLAMIVFNTIVLGLKFQDQSSTFETTLEVFNNIFLAIFHIEAAIKIAGWGFFYFKDSWNKFDFLVLVITDVFLIVRILGTGSNIATIPTVIRSLRLGRIVKFIRASKLVRVLIDTIYYLLPALGNIGALLLLMMFIYAILGMNLFAEVKFQIYINERANFQSLLPAFNILIRIALGQDWPYIMGELSDTSIPGCRNDQTYEERQISGQVLGCGNSFAYPYFLSYLIIVSNILIYLFLAVVVGGYAESKKENEAVITPNQMEEFLDKWSEYDPQGTGFVSPEHFAFMIHDLPPPLGLKDENSVKYEYDILSKQNKGYLVSENKKIVLKKKQLYSDMTIYNVPVYLTKSHSEDEIVFVPRVHFSDVCKVISYNSVIRVYKPKEDLEINSEYVNKTLAKGWMNRYGVLKKLQKETKQPTQFDLPPLRVTEYYAGKSIIGFLIKWKEDQRVDRLQLQEKLGMEFDGFQLQQRIANLEIQRAHPNEKPLKRERINRKNSLSLNSLANLRENISNKSSGDNMDSGGTMNSMDHVIETTQSPGQTRRELLRAESHLDSLNNYKRMTVIQKLTQVNPNNPRFYDDGESWLQKGVMKTKFPVPVNMEVDKFLLDCLDQPETISLKESELNTDDRATRSGVLDSNNDLSSTYSKITSRKNIESENSRRYRVSGDGQFEQITEEEKFIERRETNEPISRASYSTESKIRRTKKHPKFEIEIKTDKNETEMFDEIDK